MKLSDALKYGVAEAKGLTFDSSGSNSDAERLRAATHQFATNNDLTALAGIVDLLQENDHPVHPFVAKVLQGQGVERPWFVNRGIDVFTAQHLAPTPAEVEAGVKQPPNLRTMHLGLNPKNAGEKGAKIGFTPIRLRDGHTAAIVDFHAEGSDYSHGRSFMVPASKEELDQYAEGVKEIAPDHHSTITQNTFGPFYQTAGTDNLGWENRTRAELGFPLLPEQAEHHKSIQKALRYVTAKPEEWLQHLADPEKGDLHQIWADLLEDNEHPTDLAERVRAEGRGQGMRMYLRPEDAATQTHRIKVELNNRHPSAAIRALTYRSTPQEHQWLIDALRHSPSEADQDAGVFLAAGEKPHAHHPALKHFNQLKGSRYNSEGLMPKLIGDTLYLLDWEHPQDGSYGAPAIRYHAHIGDQKDLDGMVQHAEQLRQERENL